MSLLSIGVSGLRSNQTSLQITGNNIANADVEGYSRQRTEVVTAPSQGGSSGFVGTGVKVETIARVADQYLFTQIQLDTASYNSVATYGENVEQLASLIAGEFSSLSPSLASMFSAIEVSIEDPTSMPSRQLVLSEAEGFVERVHTIYDRLEQQSNSVDEQMLSLTSEVTSLAKGIAELNQSISRELGISQGASPNGLLDSRDELIRQLAEIVSVRTTTDSSGMMNVFVGNGQPLVVGNVASSLGVEPSAKVSGTYDISFIGTNGNSASITSAIQGGKLGGLLDFRTQALEPAFNAIGRIVLAVTDTLNQTNKQGLDLEGNFGSTIFQDINNANAMGRRSSTITGVAQLAVSIQDIGLLSSDNYTLSVTSSAVPQSANLINETTGEVIAGTFVPNTDIDGDGSPDGTVFTPLDSTKTEGLAIIVNSGSLTAGDAFYLQPTRHGSLQAGMEMRRPQELAYASPVVTGASLNNSGGAIISPGEVLEAFDRAGNASPGFSGASGSLSPPISIVFTSASNYEVYDSSTNTLLFSDTFVQGQNNPVFETDPSLDSVSVPPGSPFYLGFQVELSGTPSAGDTFTIDFNGSGISDNRNGIDLGSSRVEGVMDQQTLNYEDAYGRLVEDIGANTAQNRILKDSTSSLLAASTSNRSSISGVNLDEEAANLIKFEQAYNANAQIITVARQIFDTLLNAFR